MKRIGLLLLVTLAFVGCARAACPGYERIDYGSRCRELGGSRHFVSEKHCDQC